MPGGGAGERRGRRRREHGGGRDDRRLRSIGGVRAAIAGASGLGRYGGRSRTVTSSSRASASPSLFLITLSGRIVLTLLPQDPAQALDVGFVELAVARRRALGIEQTLALEEADLRDGDVGELVAAAARAPRRSTGGCSARVTSLDRRPPARNTSLNLPICSSSPLASTALVDPLSVHVGAVQRADVARRR